MSNENTVLAGCAGGGEQSCTKRPDYVVTYFVNPSGLPGLGKDRVLHACYRHLHRVLQVAVPTSAFHRAQISQYEGA